MSACMYCGSYNCSDDCRPDPPDDDEVCEECGDHKDNCHCADDCDGPDEPEFNPDAADDEADRHFAQGRE